MNFKKPTWIIIVAAIVLVAVLSVGFAVNRSTNEPLIEMQIVYEENPAKFFDDMKLIWGDIVYHETPMTNAQRGKQVGFANDEHSTWRIYEVRGHGRVYLFAVENTSDALRVMSSIPPETPWRQYILESMDDFDRLMHTRSFTLYSDGIAVIAESPLSSFMLAGVYYYTLTDDELLIHQEDDNLIARFEIIDDYTIVFKSATIPLRAEVGARYVR